MSNSLVNYQLDGAVATVTMNDGAKNVISPKMIKALNQALDKAEKDEAIVILTGHGDILSAGFDLKVFKSSASETLKMVLGGFTLSRRLLSFPTPVIIANNGHAIAMGAFLLLSGDYRIGTSGSFKIVTNEVAIGLTIPLAGIAISRQRLTPAHFERASLLSEEYNPETALQAGFLDKVVSAENLIPEAMEAATRYSKLNPKAHRETKLRARKKMLRKLKWAIRMDRFDLIYRGLKTALTKSSKK